MKIPKSTLIFWAFTTLSLLISASEWHLCQRLLDHHAIRFGGLLLGNFLYVNWLREFFGFSAVFHGCVMALFPFCPQVSRIAPLSFLGVVVLLVVEIHLLRELVGDLV